MSESIAVLEKVSYMYPRSTDLVLRDISLEIKQGEFFGIIGPTGAGKTTFCLSLNGIVPQFYGGRFFGSVKINGMDTLDYPISQMAGMVGEVFEDPETQLIATSVENEIAFALENLKFPREEILARIPPVLEAVRLGGMEKKIPGELSGGQKQRLAIAAALAVQPNILVLDEPTSQLDPIGSQEVFSTVRELNKELGITIVMSSHASEEMAEFADRVALLSKGEVLTIGSPDAVYSDIERLYQNDLRPPQVASTYYFIKQRKVPISKIPVNLQEGLSMLPKVLRQNRYSAPVLKISRDQKEGAPLLSVKNLKHIYPDGTQAIHDISLDIREGDYVLIVGQNGAGKSTLVKHFLTLLKPTEGEVLVNGVDTRELTLSGLAKRIGYVAQNPDNQIFNSSVGDEVSFAIKNLGFAREEVERRTVESLESMGLLEVRDQHPLSLPKGDRARVVIAAILAMHPEIIIFDEPTTGQDYRGAKYILEISRQLHQAGKTVIVITHHLYLMPEYAERVIVVGKGTLLLDAPIREAYHATDLLRSTFLTPPQAVLMAQEIENIMKQAVPKLLTPAEVADCFLPSNNGRSA